MSSKSLADAVIQVSQARDEIESLNKERKELLGSNLDSQRKVIEFLKRHNVKSGSFVTPEGVAKRARISIRSSFSSLHPDVITQVLSDDSIVDRFVKELQDHDAQEREAASAPRKKKRAAKVVVRDGEEDNDASTDPNDQPRRKIVKPEKEIQDPFVKCLYVAIFSGLSEQTKSLSETLEIVDAKGTSRNKSIDIASTDPEALRWVLDAWDVSDKLSKVNADRFECQESFAQVCRENSQVLNDYLQQRDVNSAQFKLKSNGGDPDCLKKYTLTHAKSTFTTPKFKAPLRDVLLDITASSSPTELRGQEAASWFRHNRDKIRSQMLNALERSKAEEIEKAKQKIRFSSTPPYKPKPKKNT